MTKSQEMISLYKGVIAYVSAHNGGVDEGVAYDMIMHEMYAKKGLFGRTHKYEIPAGFDWDAWEKDLNK